MTNVVLTKWESLWISLHVNKIAESSFNEISPYSINPCWILDIPAGDWNNFSKALIATRTVEEIIILQVALLSIVICPPVWYWQLITLVFLLHTDNSPRKSCMSCHSCVCPFEMSSFVSLRINFDLKNSQYNIGYTGIWEVLGWQLKAGLYQYLEHPNLGPKWIYSQSTATVDELTEAK